MNDIDAATPLHQDRAGSQSSGAQGASRASRLDRSQLTMFFVLAFLLSWAGWPLVLLNPDSSPLVPFGPAFAAVAITALLGRGRVWQLVRQLTRWRAKLVWYVVAITGPFAVMGLAGAITVMTGAPAPGVEILTAWYTLPVTLLSTMVIVGLFEELGWRGYALPRLQETHSALWSALVLGVVWAAWHLPELVSDPTEQRPPLPFLVYIVALSVILTWLYNSTRGSLPVVIVAHAAMNTSAQFLLPEFAGTHYLTAFWTMTVLYAGVAAVIAVHTGAGRPSSRPSDSTRALRR